MTPSRTTTPLGQRIQRILLERKGEPVSLLELQTILRRQGQRINPERLRSVLSDTNVFTALPEQRYVLRDQFEPEHPPSEPTAARPPLFLPNLPKAQRTYMVLDLETSGLDPAKDQIIQIAALLVEDNTPTTLRSWYVQCAAERLPPALRRTLHLTDDMVKRITTSPPIDDIWPEVRAFLSNHTLVIHNARFDTGFLRHYDPLFANSVVDTMELAFLVAPESPQHKLKILADFLNINIDALDTSTIAGMPAGFRPGTDTLHNAITDILLLNEVYRLLRQRWHATPPEQATLYGTLLPEVWRTPPTAPLHIATLMDSAQSPADTAPTVVATTLDTDALSLRDRFAAHADLHSRDSQRTMIRLVAEALDNDESLLIEAPTGTGKTFGYLIPVVWAARTQGRRIALATAFKNLQDQLCGEVARLQAVIPFQAQVLKGASSYVCLQAVQQALDDAYHPDLEPDLERRFVLTCLVRWLMDCPTATLDELPYWLKRTFPETNFLAHEVAVDRATCPQHRCSFYHPCRFFTAYHQGEQADVLLINQALWLSDSALLPSFDALIFDEAHNLEAMATSALRQEVSEESLRRLLHRLYVPGTRRGALQRILDLKPDDEHRAIIHTLRRSIGQVLRLIGEFRTTLSTFVTGCDERLDPAHGAQLRLTGAPERIYPTRWKMVQQALDQVWHVYMPAIVTGLHQVSAWLPTDEHILHLTIQAIHSGLTEQQQLLQTILRARRSDLVAWIEVCTDEQTGGWGFFTAPISVAPILAERYRELRSVVLTSATLTTGPRDFRFFVERLGLRELLAADQMHALAGELPYQQNALLGLPTYLSYTPAQSTLQSYVEELSEELVLLLRFTEGRGLVLFTARTRLEEVWQRNALRLEGYGVPIFAQRGNESRPQLIEQFQNHGHAVLYGLKSFWEGIDVPGEALSLVVMEKLPYPYLGDPVHAARREAIARQNGREFHDYLFPLMVIQFKQGFGRLLRNHDDRGAVILYDKRVSRKSYLPELLGALPGFQPRDLNAERSRRAFYRLIAERLPGLIDLDEKATLLETLPDILSTNLEELVERLAIPDPLPDADYAMWRPRILEALKELYGFDDFRTPEQEAALRALLTGQDLLVVLPTGAGKSLTFQLPALLRKGTTVVCSPLIALMRDQIDKLSERGIEIAAALMSGQNAAEREEILARVRAGRVRLLYLAPERLRDPVVLSTLATAPIRQIVVDEAHCVALWGPSFRPDFLVLPHIYQQLAQRPPVAAFTATATPAITQAITTGLALHQPDIVRSSINRPELRLIVLDRHHPYFSVRSKKEQIQRLLMLVQVADRSNEAMLIYVATTRESEYLARLLQVAGYAARAYHGKMPVQERTNVGELFMEGLITIVVCTKAFGMGIDKPDIRYVVHFHVPGDLESYFQEVGRAGRDGETAYGIVLYHPSDEQIQRYFIDQSRPDSALLGTLWQWIGTQPVEWVMEPQATGEQFDIDELELRRAIYLLEQAHLLRRGSDVTLRGTLTLLGTWDEVLERAPAQDRLLLEQLRAALPMAGWSPQEIVLADVAQQMGVPVQPFEDVLIHLSEAEGCLYRPWEKGYHITRIAPPETPLPAVGDDVVVMQEDKLLQIRDYVQTQGCRWQALRRYFGEDEGQPCGTCDRCTPNQHYPWSSTTGRDVPDVSDFLDLATTLLELTDWNERRQKEGYAPFGIGTMIRILRGDEYALMQRYPPGPAAEARRRTLRACPYWGVCRTLRRSAASLDALFHRLIQEGYLERAQAQLELGTYDYATLTERGRTQLFSGERLGWS